MSKSYYIASCIFTSKFPELSRIIQAYIQERFQMPIVRCCVPNYKLEHFTEQMPKDYQKDWSEMPDCADFQPGDMVYSLCHNCSAVIEETKPGVQVRSIWELILEDEDFSYPDYHGEEITIQDCWRSKERIEEQEAVRQILKKINFKIHELKENHEQTDFCGISLYQPAPPRNIKLAPKRFVENAQGKFLPHTEEEKEALMKDYCKQIETERIVAYCHYCLDGLLLGGADAIHLAHLLFQ